MKHTTIGHDQRMTIAKDREPLLTTAELAAYLQVPVHTLRKWRITGGGPEASKVGKHLRYRREDVDRWLASTRAVRARRTP